MRDAVPQEKLRELLAAYGAEFSRWPFAAAGREARAMLLRDPSFRRAWEAERRLDHLITAARTEVDGELDAAGAAQRTKRRVIAATAPRAVRLPWAPIAAAVVIAALIGGTVDTVFLPNPAAPEIVLVDNLLYGPEEVEL